jgi:hypothetical protein
MPGPLTVTDTCIMYRLTIFDASRYVILHIRYISTCVGARVVGGGNKETINKKQKLSSVTHLIIVSS